MDLKEEIFGKLEVRNKLYNRFGDLIVSHAKLYESNKEYQSLNANLKNEVEKLKQENNDLARKVNSGRSSFDRREHSSALEQKLYKIQEELTEVHRTKGHRAQQIIDLNMALQEKEKELIRINEQLKERNEALDNARNKLAKYEQENSDLKQANIMLKDEYQALQITSEAFEKKLRNCQVENQTLIERWMHYKDKEAKELNSENAKIQIVLKEKTTSSSTPIPQPPGGGRREQTLSVSSTSSSSSPSAMNTSVSFKDKVSSFFGRKPAKPENEPQVTLATSRQYFTHVHLPEEVVCNWKAHESEVTSTRFFAGGILATGGSDKFINIWNFIGDKPRLQYTLRGCNGGVTSVDVDPPEQCIAASSTDYACRIWTLNTQRMKLTLTGHSGSVLSNKFLFSNRLVSGSKDRTVKVWDVSSGACTRTFMAGSSCNDIVAVDSAECVASGHFDKKIRMWDARVSSSVQNEIVVGGRITSLDMPVDRTSLVCCTKDHSLELIDLRKSAVVSVFRNDSFRVVWDQTRCSFSDDGKYVCVGSSDGTVLSWDVKTGKLSSMAREHNDPVIACDWACGRLVTGDKNKHCNVWTDS